MSISPVSELQAPHCTSHRARQPSTQLFPFNHPHKQPLLSQPSADHHHPGLHVDATNPASPSCPSSHLRSAQPSSSPPRSRNHHAPQHPAPTVLLPGMPSQPQPPLTPPNPMRDAGPIRAHTSWLQSSAPHTPPPARRTPTKVARCPTSPTSRRTGSSSSTTTSSTSSSSSTTTTTTTCSSCCGCIVRCDAALAAHVALGGPPTSPVPPDLHPARHEDHVRGVCSCPAARPTYPLPGCSLTEWDVTLVSRDMVQHFHPRHVCRWGQQQQ